MQIRFIYLILVLTCSCPFWSTADLQAAPIVSGTISYQQLSADSYKYSMTLTVDASSPESVLSFWFAWIPEYDFLPSIPTAFSSPAGWTGADAPDLYGVASGLWSTNTNPIAPGQSLPGFTFTTPDPPSAIIDALYTPLDLPVTTSYAYSYPQARGDYEIFVPTFVSVPEPKSLMILFSGMAALFWRKSRRSSDENVVRSFAGG